MITENDLVKKENNITTVNEYVKNEKTIGLFIEEKDNKITPMEAVDYFQIQYFLTPKFIINQRIEGFNIIIKKTKSESICKEVKQIKEDYYLVFCNNND